MSIKTLRAGSWVEQSDDFHLARILILLYAASGRTNKPVKGIMKLAKMDFLLRYPNCLARVLIALGLDSDAEKITEAERNTIEARMIRFRYGPWDPRYRKWISLLSARALVDVSTKGRTVYVRLSEAGLNIAKKLASMDDFLPLVERGKLVGRCVGDFPATKLKDFIYDVFPEITGMTWGKDIEL
jgi:hypothetical protein